MADTNGHHDPDDLDELAADALRRLLREDPDSGRGKLAQLGAARLVERQRRGRRDVPPRPDHWHPCPDFAEVDRCDSEATRDRWYAAVRAVRSPR